mgnify:CR=1 FL=1
MNNQLTTQQFTYELERTLENNIAAIYLAGKVATSRRVLLSDLNAIAELLGHANCSTVNWGKLRYKHTQAIRTKLAETRKPATVNRMLSALRGALKAAWLNDDISERDYKKAIEVKGVKNETLPSGSNDNRPAGIRDAAIIAVLYTCGLRRAEVVSLKITDLNQETGELKVTGKGNKEREAWALNGARRALNAWLELRSDLSEALFQPINRGGNIQPKHMVKQSIYDMLARRAKQAGIENFSPHDLRRTFITDILEAGADLSTAAKLAGHKSPQTTMRYDKRDNKVKMQAVSLLHIPFSG